MCGGVWRSLEECVPWTSVSYSGFSGRYSPLHSPLAYTAHCSLVQDLTSVCSNGSRIAGCMAKYFAHFKRCTMRLSR